VRTIGKEAFERWYKKKCQAAVEDPMDVLYGTTRSKVYYWFAQVGVDVGRGCMSLLISGDRASSNIQVFSPAKHGGSCNVVARWCQCVAVPWLAAKRLCVLAQILWLKILINVLFSVPALPGWLRAFSFSTANQLRMTILYGHAGRSTVKKRRFPTRAVRRRLGAGRHTLQLARLDVHPAERLGVPLLASSRCLTAALSALSSNTESFETR
jgi:hypothetical protein